MGKLIYNEQDFQKAAIQFDRDLIKIPMCAMRDTTKYMTVRTGVRGTVLLGQESVDAEFAPYKKTRRTSVDLDLKLRALTTYFGSLNADFDPNEAMNTLLDHRANQAMGDALQSTPTAREVLALIAKRAGAKAARHLFDAVRNPKGDKTKDLFDGFDTITLNDIEDGEVSEANRNLTIIDEEITADNAYPILTDLIESLDDELRDAGGYLFTSRKIADAYNRSYKKYNGGIPYNNRFEQEAVEGSSGLIKIIPVIGKKNSSIIHITPKQNIIVGCDQESDAETVRVKEFDIDTLTMMMRMFLGCQFKTVAPELFHAAIIRTPQTDDPELPELPEESEEPTESND